MSFVGISNVAQTILPHTSNIGYQVRGAYRIETAVPDDRRIDYWYRDMFQPLISTLGIDLAIRMADYYLAFPAYTKALELDKLTELYGKKGFEAVKNYSYKDMGRAGLMQHLRERIVHASKGGSYDSIPRLFEKADLPGMSDEARKEGQVVAQHLKRRLNYTQYIDDVLLPQGSLSARNATLLKDSLYRHNFAEILVKEVEKDLAAFKPAVETLASKGTLTEKSVEVLKEAFKALHLDAPEMKKGQRLDEVIEALARKNQLEAGQKTLLREGLEMASKALRHNGAKPLDFLKKLAEEQVGPKIAGFLKEGFQSKEVIRQLKRIKNLNFWPQMLGNVLYSFVIVGTLASAIDVKKIQPWQEKLVKQGYDSNIIMKPAYLSFLPAIGVFAAIHKSKAMKKLGYLKHFTATWTAALATYTALTFLWTKHRIKNTKPNPPAPERLNAIPQGFIEAPLQHPAFYNAFSKFR